MVGRIMHVFKLKIRLRQLESDILALTPSNYHKSLRELLRYIKGMPLNKSIPFLNCMAYELNMGQSPDIAVIESFKLLAAMIFSPDSLITRYDHQELESIVNSSLENFDDILDLKLGLSDHRNIFLIKES